MTKLLIALLIQTEDPLHPLTNVAKELNKGIAEFLKGTPVSEAFAGWNAEARKADELRRDLKNAGVESLANFAFEFDLSFYREGKLHYQIKLLVYADDSTAALVEFRGQRPMEDQVTDSAAKLESVPKPLQGFVESAKLLQDSWKAKKTDLKFLEEDAIRKLVQDEKAVAELSKDIARSKDRVQSAIDDLNSGAWDELRVRIDDQIFLARDKDGNAVGSVAADFDLSDSKFGYKLKKFEPLKK